MPKQNGPADRRIIRERTVPGLLVFEARGKLLSSNPIARQILRYDPQGKLLQKIQSVVFSLNGIGLRPNSAVHSPPVRLIQAAFSSGRRRYGLQAFLLDSQPEGQPAHVAVVMERINPSRLNLHKAKRLFDLSPREVETIQALETGVQDKEIASALGICPETVRCYLKSIRAKLGVSSRTAILNRILSL